MTSGAAPAARPLDLSCAGLLPQDAATDGDPTLYDDTEGTWLIRSDLRAQVLALATGLAAPRKRLIFLLASNRSASICGLLAAAAADHAVALIDPALPAKRLAHLFQVYDPDIVLSSLPLDALPVSVWGSGSWRRPPAAGRAPAAAIREESGADINPNLFLMLSTSGTTGSPKFVRLSSHAVVANALQIATVLGIGRESVGIAHLPLHYSYGLSVATSHLVSGGRVFVIDDAITSPGFWTKVADAGGTHFPGVPFHHTVLMRLGFDLMPARVDTLTQSGSALDLRVQKAMHEKAAARGARFFVMYGQTEAAPRMTILPHEDFESGFGSVGRAVPGGSLKILDASGARELGPDETGAVVYEGPNVMLGYAEQRADLANGDEMRGRLETGDVGRLDASGFLFLSGRTTRFVKVAGLRLSLDEIEQELAAQSFVACLDGGERIVVCYEEGPEADLKNRFRDLAQEYKIPSASFLMRHVPTIPRQTSGKVDYVRLKEIVRV